MKTREYIVTQTCQGRDILETSNRTAQKYKFTPSIPRGTYTEKEFLQIVGENFLQSQHFGNLTKCGYIKVIEKQDVTNSTVSKYKDKKEK